MSKTINNPVWERVCKNIVCRTSIRVSDQVSPQVRYQISMLLWDNASVWNSVSDQVQRQVLNQIEVVSPILEII